MSQQWVALPGSECLLVRWTFSTEKYIVDVTDLESCWREELDRAQIVTRAEELGISIDFEEDDQLQAVFYSQIQQTLLGQEAASDVSVTKRASRLRITITCPLPEPLPQLRWYMDMSPRSPAEFSESVTKPLLCGAFVLEQQVRNLSRLLVQKDVAIGKILDKIDSMNLDLSTFFPSVPPLRSENRAMQRSRIHTKVRGLHIFDQDQWLRSTDAFEDGVTLSHIVKQAFGAAHNARASRLHTFLSQHPQTFSIINPAPKDLHLRPESHLPNVTKFKASPSPSSSATQSDADLAPISRPIDDSPSPKVKTELSMRSPSPTQLAQSTPTRRLGVIGGSHVPAPRDRDTSSAAQTLLPSPRRIPLRLGTIGGASVPVPVPREIGSGDGSLPAQAQLLPVRRQLGRIGGHGGEQSLVTAEGEKGETASATRAGGGQHKNDGKGDSDDVVVEATAAVSKIGSGGYRSTGQAESREESLEERADRKREQLKRELEERSRTASAVKKKKRRF